MTCRRVGAHVIGMTVTAGRVVADHGTRLHRIDDRREVGGDLPEVGGAECVSGERLRRLCAGRPPAHAGLGIPSRLTLYPASTRLPEETVIGDPEGRHRPGQLRSAHLGEARCVSLEPGQVRRDDLAELAPGAGDDGHLRAALDQQGDRSAGGDALVVGMRMHEEHALEGERLAVKKV
jgi:hypothetical protein